MNLENYWNIINNSITKENQIEWIRKELIKMEVDELARFDKFIKELIDTSYLSDLWGAAYIIMGGCSDDSFEYFRAWLIAQGKDVFYKTLENPEFLASYINEDCYELGVIPELEEMLYVASEAYTIKINGNDEYDEKTDDEFFDLVEKNGYKYKSLDIDFNWEDEDDLMEMFPKLWDRFGENPLD